MSANETLTLRTIPGNGDVSKMLEPINRPGAVAGKHVGFLGDTQVSHGCIEGNRIRRYQLTSMGREILLELLREHEARAKDAMRSIKQLSIGYNQRMDIHT
jgi:hypothetical protein